MFCGEKSFHNENILVLVDDMMNFEIVLIKYMFCCVKIFSGKPIIYLKKHKKHVSGGKKALQQNSGPYFSCTSR